jgi:hypothetical protein
MVVDASTLWGLGHSWGKLLTFSKGSSWCGLTIEGAAYGDRLLEAEVAGEEAPQGLGAGEGGTAALEEADEPREGVLLEAPEVGEAAGPAGVAGVREVGAGVGDDVGDGVVELAVAVPRAEDGLERRLLAVAEVGETGQRRRVRLVQPLE